MGHFRERLGHEGALDRRALRRIRSYATALAELLAAGDPTRDGFDLPKAQEAFERLVADFLQLAGEGRAFLLNLRTAIELQKLDLQEFLAYKQWLIGYLGDFLAELSETVPHVLEALERMEAHEPGRVGPLLDRLAADDAEHASRPGEAVYEERKRARRAQWAALTGWFRPASGKPSGAEDLRRWARSAIPQLLQAVQGIHDRRGRRADRGADLATLARWFLDAPDDAAAHHLWRGVTGLHPSRHLHVDAETLDARSATPVAASTAWADAPPLDLPIRLRKTGTLDKRGRGRKVTDRRAERAALRERAEAEAEQARLARAELLTDGPVPLSAFATLSPDAFGELFELLGRAFARRTADGRAVEADSTDGRLTVRMGEAEPGAVATIHTRGGTLMGDDFVVSIVDATKSADRRAKEPQTPAVGGSAALVEAGA